MPSFITDPVRFRKLNGWLVVLWVVMIPVSIITGWVSSVEYVSALSIYALVTGHLSTWQAARVEARQQEDLTEQKVEEIRQTQHEMVQTEKLHEMNGESSSGRTAGLDPVSLGSNPSSPAYLDPVGLGSNPSSTA